MSTMVIVIIVLALVFDYINGFHDAANSIATVVSTKVLTPLQAVIWAAFFNFVAYFIFKDHAVANTIAKTVVDTYITLPVILAGLVAAIFWNLLTWWYGIPSSSSHTLIGGFAGAAVTHAYITKGYMPFGDIIEADKISKTVMFIFLAPLIGMLISTFITLVTIRRNTWGKLAIIGLATLGMWLMFGMFREQKLEENLQKFFKVDKYKKELAKHPDDEKVKEKLEKAKAHYSLAKTFTGDFDEVGGEVIASRIADTIDLEYIEAGKLKDVLSRKLKLEKLKKDAYYDESLTPIYEANLALLDSCKPYFALYRELGSDSVAHACANILGVRRIDNYEKFAKSFNVDAKKDLGKELNKADNRFLMYCIGVLVLIFMLSYIW